MSRWTKHEGPTGAVWFESGGWHVGQYYLDARWVLLDPTDTVVGVYRTARRARRAEREAFTALRRSHERAQAILADPERVARLRRPARDDVEPLTGEQFRERYGIAIPVGDET